MRPVTYLFVPGNRPERFAKALSAGAGMIILDLEDAVAPDDKAAAREAIRAWLGAGEVPLERIAVRINDSATAWYADDLALVRDCALGFVMLPKAEFAAQIDSLRAAIPQPPRVIALVESARGINNVNQIALAEGVERLAFGTLDYAADLGLSGQDIGLVFAHSQIAIASRCAELPSPIAGVTPSLDDPARMEADFAFARAFGFGAKMCIHPRQVAIVERAARPTEAEIEWAGRVIAAAQAGGVVSVDGKMVDRPVVLRAEDILARTSAPHP